MLIRNQLLGGVGGFSNDDTARGIDVTLMTSGEEMSKISYILMT